MNDSQVLLAIQLLTKSITDLPLAIQTVLSGGQQPPLDPGTPGAGPGQRPGTAPAQGNGPDVTRVYVTNENWAAPVPVRIDGDGAGAPKDAKDPKDAKGPKEPALPGMGALLAPLTLVAAKFAAVAGPLAILGAVLGSASSGFQTLGIAVKVLAGTLAPVLLPATILLSTALVALSDVVLAMLMPGMEGFFGVMFAIGIPAIVAFVDVVRDATERLIRWASYLKRDDVQEVVETAGEVGGVLRDVNEITLLGPIGVARVIDRKRDEYEEATGEGPLLATAAGATKESTSDIVMRALKDVGASFSLSTGPKAQIGGLEGIGKGVQLAALNQDPLEARMLRTQEQIRNMLERVVAGLGGSSGVYVPGEGDFSGSHGSGGSFGGDF